MPAPPAGADRDEGVALDPVLIVHEAQEMPADAVADMGDAQPRRRLDQGVQSGGHVQPPPVGIVHRHGLQIIGPRPGYAPEVIGQHRRAPIGHVSRETLVKALWKAGSR
ncbi:hypothetical protein D3C72_1107210 [compost metagenome]